MIARRYRAGALLLLSAALFAGCSSQPNAPKAAVPAAAEKKTSQPELQVLQEDVGVYSRDKPDQLYDIYLTIVKSGTTADNKEFTFEDINHQTRHMPDGQSDPQVQVIFQEGTPNGPQDGYFGFGEKSANGTLNIRGSSTRAANQKSYKIKLNSRAGLWNEQKTVNLIKSPYDLTRVRNKLSYDLFKGLPNFTSLRSHFVHVHIKDLTKPNPDQQFVDYGLYTNVEQPNKSYLKFHGLDPNGNLYKVVNFEFLRYPNQLKLATEEGYNKKEFEKILEIYGSENHKKLLSMLDDLNDYTKDINEVLDKHFNKDNYFTWVATNILLGDTDSNAQNFMLYSPSDSEQFFFLPWDYDGAWGYMDQRAQDAPDKNAPWIRGLSNYWGTTLAKRVFKNPDNIKALNDKMEQLSQYFSKDKVTNLLKAYYPISKEFVNKKPDLYSLPMGIDNYEKEYWRIVDEPLRNKDVYYKNLEKPMPIFLADPADTNGMVTFNWDQSYDLQGDDLVYDFTLSSDPGFQKVIVAQKDIRGSTFTMDKPLAKGTYYWKVTVRDSKGNSQIAFDDFEDAFGNLFHGVREYVK
ncbi:CotH kinase family protein [Paenibacillus rigui]|uniref:Spore coat protein n=1 Tax=Paenibacillus rigui TaxID=554312 RepID=A0A229UT95_9BACL|nr:CotH kinase family protein [Paenibacillus rigui]OXM86658.1 spore coat protein [Paenibacillus rigui]